MIQMSPLEGVLSLKQSIFYDNIPFNDDNINYIPYNDKIPFDEDIPI